VSSSGDVCRREVRVRCVGICGESDIEIERILARCSAPLWNGVFLATTGWRGGGWYRMARSPRGAGK
jgi:hypothetical protein